MNSGHPPVGEHQIGEAKQREQVRLVLRQPAVAGPLLNLSQYNTGGICRQGYIPSAL